MPSKDQSALLDDFEEAWTGQEFMLERSGRDHRIDALEFGVDEARVAHHEVATDRARAGTGRNRRAKSRRGVERGYAGKSVIGGDAARPEAAAETGGDRLK